MKPITVGRLSLVIVTVLAFQAAIVSNLEVFGAHGDLLLLLGIATALAAGADTGAIVGFCAGIAVDLLTQTPFGLSALTYCLTAYAVGRMQASVLRATWWIPVVIAGVASAAGVVGFAVVGEVIGQHTLVGSELPAIVVVVAAVNALLSKVAAKVMGWVLEEELRPSMTVLR